jgi:hypothetical protein
MDSVSTEIPRWIQRALQGITYWIGHRRCLYRRYPLAEGALVAEVCNLIHANLPDELLLKCEVQYSDLLRREIKYEKEARTILTQKSRADLVIVKRSTNRFKKNVPTFIIEVKRASAPKSQIVRDLCRLAEASRRYPSIKTFMFLIAESHRPNDFVDEHGKSRKKKFSIAESSGHYYVRKTWKAAHALSTIERAQYACLIEVFGQ